MQRGDQVQLTAESLAWSRILDDLVRYGYNRSTVYKYKFSYASSFGIRPALALNPESQPCATIVDLCRGPRTIALNIGAWQFIAPFCCALLRSLPRDNGRLGLGHGVRGPQPFTT